MKAKKIKPGEISITKNAKTVVITVSISDLRELANVLLEIVDG